jgi:hypothetical protein
MNIDLCQKIVNRTINIQKFNAEILKSYGVKALSPRAKPQIPVRADSIIVAL